MLKLLVISLYFLVFNNKYWEVSGWFFGSDSYTSDVIEANDEDFDHIMPEFDTAVVLFYVPWCPHCQKFIPEFERAAKKLARNTPPVASVKVDCAGSGKATCNAAGVNGYPTVKVFKHGHYVKAYEGPRDADDVVQYMVDQIGPASTETESKNEGEGDAVTVFGRLRRNSGLYVGYMAAAEALRDHAKFFHSFEDDVNETVTVFRPKYLYNKFEEAKVVYVCANESFDVAKFVRENMHGLVGYRTNYNKKMFSEPLVIAYLHVDYKLNKKQTNYWRNRLLKVAKQYEQKVSFAVSDLHDCKEELTTDFGTETISSEYPLITARKGKKFLMPYKFSLDALESFVGELLDNKLEPFVKSQIAPKENNGTVAIVVAENFDNIVRNNGKDTILLFHSPECPRCEDAIPIFENLASDLKDEDIVFAKMDGTSNDIPSEFFDFEEYPAIYIVYSEGGNQKYSEEEVTLEELKTFVARFATNELKGYTRLGYEKAVDKEEKIEL